MLLRRAVSVLGLVLACASAVLDTLIPCACRLPAPQGPFRVGRTQRHWVDPSRPPWVTDKVPTC
eukprot:3960109-Pyramimonas_sp.AAC.1